MAIVLTSSACSSTAPYFSNKDDKDFETRITRSIHEAESYLRRHAKEHVTRTDTQVEIAENFSQFLILEATGDSSLVHIERSERLYNFFRGAGQLTTSTFPCDLDTTSIALTVLGASDRATLDSILDEMLSYRSEDGILPVYFDRTRNRVDPVVCLNALSLFYLAGRGSEVDQTLTYVLDVLENRGYLDGTRYYHSAEIFLYFATRFASKVDSLSISNTWKPLIRARLLEFRRAGKSIDPLATSMRILCANLLGVPIDRTDVDLLLQTQCPEGRWKRGWFFKYGSSGILCENSGLTTAFAYAAITKFSWIL